MDGNVKAQSSLQQEVIEQIPPHKFFLIGNANEWMKRARSSLSRLAFSQTGMSAGRNLMEWKSRRRDVPERLEPSLSDGASA